MPLPPNWFIATTEPSETSVKAHLLSELMAIKQDVDLLLKDPVADRPARTVPLLSNIKDLLDSAKELRESATKQPWPNMAAQLKGFINQLRQWRAIILTSIAGEQTQNTRTRFSDAGSWGMHFSTVRMGISTFFITAAWGLVSLKWNEYSDELYAAAWAVWGLAGIFLVLFTLLLADAGSRQGAYRSKLPALPGTERSGFVSKRLLGFKLVRGFLGILLPVLIFAGMTWLFWCLMARWSEHGKEPSFARTSLVEGATAQGVKLSEWGAKIDAITKSLNEIKTKLPQPTPTITPTPTPKTTQGKGHGRRGHRHRR